MPNDRSNRSGETSQSILHDPRLKTFLIWVQSILLVFAALNILVAKFLPEAIKMPSLTVLSCVEVIAFICVVSIFEVIFWRLRKELPRDAFYGFMLMVVGVMLVLPAGAVCLFVMTFLPESPLAPNVVAAAAIAMAGAMAILFIGLLLVIAKLPGKFVRMYRDGRLS